LSTANGTWSTAHSIVPKLIFFRVSYEKGIIHKLSSKTQKRPSKGLFCVLRIQKAFENPIYKSLPKKLGLTFELDGPWTMDC